VPRWPATPRYVPLPKRLPAPLAVSRLFVARVVVANALRPETDTPLRDERQALKSRLRECFDRIVGQAPTPKLRNLYDALRLFEERLQRTQTPNERS
jgi:hypothetical protein